ncbi:hypothetical protein RB653_005705 [Dictyostelium firmibasis]|uniref:GATA-type domain-containing protein n=1 Tax=Dictyostelium firmibasis TaxID=79012 RepID=A0AAN7UBY8_9MYCE
MAKRNNPPSINIASDNTNKYLKKTNQIKQTTKKYKTKREKQVHRQIEKIKSERMFIYKNIHRYLRFSLDPKENSIDLINIVNDYIVTLKEFDILEINLKAELDTISTTSNNNNNNSSNSNSFTFGAPSIQSQTGRKGFTGDNVDHGLDEEDAIVIDRDSSPVESIDLTMSSDSSSTSTSPSKRVSKSKNRVPRNANGTATNSTATNNGDATEASTANTAGSNNSALTTTTSPPKKKRGRPAKQKPESCHNCRRTQTSYWRIGKDGDLTVDLCNACGLNYKKRGKDEKLSKEKNDIKNVLN